MGWISEGTKESLETDNHGRVLSHSLDEERIAR